MAASSTEITSVAQLVRAAFAADHVAPPCFYWTRCGRQASLEKAGRSVCRPCSTAIHGAEYPLRNPCAEAAYASERLAAEALDMIEDRSATDSPRRTFEDSNVED